MACEEVVDDDLSDDDDDDDYNVKDDDDENDDAMKKMMEMMLIIKSNVLIGSRVTNFSQLSKKIMQPFYCLDNDYLFKTRGCYTKFAI